MGLFSRQETEPEEGRLHHALRMAFEHVRRDTSNIFEWIRYFHHKHQQHDQRLDNIEQQLAYIPKSHQEIKQIIDSYYSYDSVLGKIEELNKRMDSLEHIKQDSEKKISLKERLVRKITKNSKDYVKSVIISMIRKYGRISAPQLKEILVDEQGMCSKSSFYRLLAEIEQENEISTIQAGKEKVYLSKNQVIK